MQDLLLSVAVLRKKTQCLLLILFTSMPFTVFAELTIEITQGINDPTPIAISLFEGEDPSARLSAIIAADLQRSGLFRSIPPGDMLAWPSREQDIFYRDWRSLGAQYLVIGQVQTSPAAISLSFGLYDVLNQRRIVQSTLTGQPSALRDIAHRAADKIYETITGIPGAFATQILYIEDLGRRYTQRYRLMLADADGARERVLFQSREPLLSPSWSADKRFVAYVSFETSRPAIFIQNPSTGERRQVTNFKGLNGAPAWSPDGKKLALVLSKDGNPEIYTLDLASSQLTRITRHFGIDTEPNWTEKGDGIIFTSNRGGNPQIYQVTLSSGRVERLTFEGDYNARPRISPDGKSLVMVHRRQGQFHIAWQNIASGDMRILTETWLDESPSIAPNGAMLLYATKYEGKGVLAAVSMDAGIKYRLPSKKGDVREPAWSPFTKKE